MDTSDSTSPEPEDEPAFEDDEPRCLDDGSRFRRLLLMKALRNQRTAPDATRHPWVAS